jgi:hypothetical protein
MYKKVTVLLFLAASCYAQTSFQLHGTAAELSSGVVTPAIGPTGQAVVNGTGSITFDAAGVSFGKCCTSTNNAYYKFTGAQLGNIVNASAGQVTVVLTSRYTFAQRQALSGSRYIFDVQDVVGSPGTQQFGLSTQANSAGISLSYWTGAKTFATYFIPAFNADTMFGAGIPLKVTLAWGSSGFTLALNDVAVKTTTYAPPVFSWSASSVFLIGAQPYGGNGFNSSDDAISELTVTGNGILPVGTAPVFTSANTTSFVGGSPANFVVTASGNPAAVLAQSGALPAGITFNAATGALSGTPSAVGAYSLNFTATNSAGSASQAFTLNVTQPSTVAVACTGIYDSVKGTVSLDCPGSSLIPSTVFSDLTVLVTLPGNLVAQWQADRKYLAAFASSK